MMSDEVNVQPTQPTTETPKSEAKPDTFTQADLDRIVGERAKRASETAVKQLLKELGFEAPDDGTVEAIKSKLTAAQKAEDAQKSELQKMQERITAAEQKVIAAEAERQKVVQERQIEKRDNAILKALTDAKAIAADDVLIIMAGKHPDMITATMKEDGTLDNKAVEALVTKAKTERKQDFRSGNPGTPSIGTGGQNPGTDEDKQYRQRAFNRARRDI